MKSIKPKFVFPAVENPLAYEKEIPYEEARKVKDEVVEVIAKYGLTIRQAAAMLDVIKDSMLDRVIGKKEDGAKIKIDPEKLEAQLSLDFTGLTVQAEAFSDAISNFAGQLRGEKEGGAEMKIDPERIANGIVKTIIDSTISADTLK